MPMVNKRVILETLERPALERLVVLTMKRREEHNLAVYGRGLDHAPEMNEWLCLSTPHTDAKLVDFIMRDRLISAHDVIMALHARELRWAFKVLGRPGPPGPQGRASPVAERRGGQLGRSADANRPAGPPLRRGDPGLDLARLGRKAAAVGVAGAVARGPLRGGLVRGGLGTMPRQQSRVGEQPRGGAYRHLRHC